MATSYELWITYNSEKSKLQMPVLPEKFEISLGSNNDSVDVVELGEIIIKQARPAYEFSWESFFPKKTFEGVAVSSLKSPLKYVEKLTAWKDKTKPVHLILTDMNIDTYCTIESFKYWEEGGDVGTIYYSISLKEYREIEVRTVKVKSSVAKVTKKSSTKKSTKRTSNASTSTTYTVKKGDCLWNIAKKYYGSGSKYTVIYNANKKVIGSNPNLIYPGQVLTIPSA